MCRTCDRLVGTCLDCIEVRKVVEKLTAPGVSCLILAYAADSGSFQDNDYDVVRRRSRNSGSMSYFMKTTPMVSALERIDITHPFFSEDHVYSRTVTGSPSYQPLPDVFISEFQHQHGPPLVEETE